MRHWGGGFGDTSANMAQLDRVRTWPTLLSECGNHTSVIWKHVYIDHEISPLPIVSSSTRPDHSKQTFYHVRILQKDFWQ